MNIQIFGIKKSADTRKAERFFKERGIKFQYVDLQEKELSKGEFASVKQAVGGIDAMIDEAAKDQDVMVILCHEWSKDTQKALPEMIEYLQGEGYIFLPMFYESSTVLK